MTEKAGKDWLLKIDTGGGVFVTIGGLRSQGFTQNAEMIDATNHGSNQERTLLDGAGIKSRSLSGSGIHDGDATHDLLDTLMGTQTLTPFQAVDLCGRTYQNTCKVVTYERTGDYNTEQPYSISLESSGAQIINP